MAHSFGDPCLRDATKWGSGNHAMQWSNLNFAGLPLGLAYHRWMWEFLLWFLSINEKVVSPKKCAGLLLGLISWYRFWKNKADSSRDLQTIYYVVVQHGECNAKLSDTRLFGPFLPSHATHHLLHAIRNGQETILPPDLIWRFSLQRRIWNKD